MLKKFLVIICAASYATSVINANQAIAPLVSEERVEQEQQELVKQGQKIVRQLREQGYTDEQIAQLLIEVAENDDLRICVSGKVYYMLLGAAGVTAVLGGGFALYKYVIEPKLRQRAQIERPQTRLHADAASARAWSAYRAHVSAQTAFQNAGNRLVQAQQQLQQNQNDQRARQQVQSAQQAFNRAQAVFTVTQIEAQEAAQIAHQEAAVAVRQEATRAAVNNRS